MDEVSTKEVTKAILKGYLRNYFEVKSNKDPVFRARINTEFNSKTKLFRYQFGSRLEMLQYIQANLLAAGRYVDWLDTDKYAIVEEYIAGEQVVSKFCAPEFLFIKGGPCPKNAYLKSLVEQILETRLSLGKRSWFVSFRPDADITLTPWGSSGLKTEIV